MYRYDEPTNVPAPSNPSRAWRMPLGLSDLAGDDA
jgi:hypothetical protein